MAALLILLLIGVPAAEIALFIQVGGALGLWPTLGLIFGTALIGGLILRFQGLSMLARAREAIGRNELPVAEIFHGLGLALSAVLLLTPGFITDFLGALLLVPLFRRALIRAARHRLEARIAFAQQGTRGAARDRSASAGPASAGKVIEGEYSEITPDKEKLPPPLGSWKGKD